MKIAMRGDFELHIPTSGGKAGKGNQKTSTVQVRQCSYIVAQFRFKMHDNLSYENAIKKAEAFIDTQNRKLQ